MKKLNLEGLRTFLFFNFLFWLFAALTDGCSNFWYTAGTSLIVGGSVVIFTEYLEEKRNQNQIL